MVDNNFDVLIKNDVHKAIIDLLKAEQLIVSALNSIKYKDAPYYEVVSRFCKCLDYIVRDLLVIDTNVDLYHDFLQKLFDLEKYLEN